MSLRRRGAREISGARGAGWRQIPDSGPFPPGHGRRGGVKGAGAKQGTAGAAAFAFRESSAGRVGRAWGQRAQEGGDASVLGRCLWGWTQGSLGGTGGLRQAPGWVDMGAARVMPRGGPPTPSASQGPWSRALGGAGGSRAEHVSFCAGVSAAADLPGQRFLLTFFLQQFESLSHGSALSRDAFPSLPTSPSSGRCPELPGPLLPQNDSLSS